MAELIIAYEKMHINNGTTANNTVPLPNTQMFLPSNRKHSSACFVFSWWRIKTRSVFPILRI